MSAPAAAGGTVLWDGLRHRLRGRLVLPSASGYNVARRLYMSQYDTVWPAAVAYCESAGDVRACVRFAQDNGLPATARSGGHGSAGYATTTGLVIDVSRLDSIRVGESTVALGAGLQFVDLVAALAPHGLAFPGGMNPTVALGGFVQGGGFGLLTRRYGMACDRVVSAEVVLADGRVVTCSPEDHPDLFWAIRGGGGGNFGIVTRYEVSTFLLRRMVNYTLSWIWDEALPVFAGWQRWALTAAPELGSSLLFVLPDAAPGHVPVVTLIGGWTGHAAELDESLDLLVSYVGHAPAIRSTRPLSFRKAMMEWYGCTDKTLEEAHTVGHNPRATLPRSGYQQSRNRLFDREIPESGLAEILAAFDSDRSAGHTRVLNAYAQGGAANRPPRTATAYVHRTTEFLLASADTVPVAAPGDEDRAAAAAWVDKTFLAYDGYSNRESYQNYIDPRLGDWRRAYYAENYDQLAAVKRVYDPDRFFRFPQAVG